MKTFQQFNEDIEQRRIDARQRTLDIQTAARERAQAYRDAQIQKRDEKRERDKLKQEIEAELQTEQTPTMQPNLYNQLVARRQASQKSAHIRHVHGEIGAEARAQQSAKQARLKSIMSR